MKQRCIDSISQYENTFLALRKFLAAQQIYILHGEIHQSIVKSHAVAQRKQVHRLGAPDQA
jgi:hypothetical protein